MPVTNPYEYYHSGTWPIPAAVNALPADDPKAQGQWSFAFDTFGAEVYDDFPPVEFILNALKTEPDVFGRQFEKFGFLPREDSDLPLGLERGTKYADWRFVYTPTAAKPAAGAPVPAAKPEAAPVSPTPATAVK